MIRKFKKTDANDCSKLIINCVKKSMDLKGENKKFMIESNNPAGVIKKTKDRNLYVNEINGKIVGIGALNGNEIRTMFVGSKLHGKGYGKQMLEFLIHKVKKQGMKNVWLKSSIVAEKFYKRLGFKKIRVRNDYNFKTIEMKKSL